LVAGFPCQPFSIAGVSKHNALGIDHGFAHPTQGNLFFEVARIIKAKQPKAFLLENVKNLQSHDKGRTFQIIKQTLSNLGYYIYYQVNEINNPQQRGMLKFFDRAFFAKDLGLQVESFIYPLSNLIPFVIEQLSSGS
jgi:DNA-cytosine methyltransferase